MSRTTPLFPPTGRILRHRRIDVDGMSIFYREAGQAGAPVLLLPHGYPCSSYQYRNLMPALADRWYLLAPDFPGFGYSDTPERERFACDFDAYADFLQRFTEALGVRRYAIWLHDYGSQIGLRHAIAASDRIEGLIIQNGDIYEDQLGPGYDGLKDYWKAPSETKRQKLFDAVSEDGFRREFTAGLAPHLAERVPPDLWHLACAELTSPGRREIMVGLMEGLKENLSWFPRYQAWLRQYRPPTLILWGPQDGYMPEGAGRAYLRDLPDADLHMLEAGHWALETNLDEIVPLVRDFLSRLRSGESRARRAV